MGRKRPGGEIDPSWPAEIQSGFADHPDCTWITRTDSYGNATTYTTDKFETPTDGVLRPDWKEPVGIS
jgi:hypothetical protein